MTPAVPDNVTLWMAAEFEYAACAPHSLDAEEACQASISLWRSLADAEQSEALRRWRRYRLLCHSLLDALERATPPG